MITKANKILLGLILTALGGSVFAAENAANINLTGSVTPACIFDKDNYTVDFGTNYGPSKPTSTITIGLNCPTGTSFSLDAGTASSTTFGGYPVQINAYKDSGYTTIATGAGSITGTGDGTFQNINLYFMATNSGSTIPVVGTFSGTKTITVTY